MLNEKCWFSYIPDITISLALEACKIRNVKLRDYLDDTGGKTSLPNMSENF